MKKNDDFSSIKTLALLSLLALALGGCGDVLGEVPGGSDSVSSGSIVSVELITGEYDEETGNQVDISRNVGGCDDGSTEFYSDHYGKVTITNRALPNSLVQTASTVYMREYDIEYIPVSYNAPAVPSRNLIPLTESVGITPCAAASTTCEGVTYRVEYVSIGQKDVIAAGYIGEQFTYNIHYIFRGVNDFGFTVSAEGYSTFYAADYDFCD